MAEGQNKTLYKKYFKSSKAEGFLTIRPWLEATKFQVEVGEVETGSLKSVSVTFPDAIELATYLKAVTCGYGESLYPVDAKNGLNTVESFIAYGGGSNNAGDVISRIIKIHYWNNDPLAFAWKCGMFEGTKAASGAVVPNLTKPISQNMIKISRSEMAIISYRADLALYGHINKIGEDFWITQS